MSTPKQIADHRQRIAFIIDRALVAAYDDFAARELTNRSEMMRQVLLEGLPLDLRQRVEETATQERI